MEEFCRLYVVISPLRYLECSGELYYGENKVEKAIPLLYTADDTRNRTGGRSSVAITAVKELW